MENFAIRRKNQLIGAGLTFDVYIDNVYLTSIKAGHEQYCENFKPGTYEIYVKAERKGLFGSKQFQSNVLTLDISDKHLQYVTISVENDFWGPVIMIR